MKRQIPIMTCFAAGVFSIASVASAQQFNGEPPANGACFYDQINYGGQYVCVEAGKEAGYINELNDKVSSVKVFGNVKVTAYEDAGFRGPTTDISQNMADLRDARWNDVISSVKVASVANASSVSADSATRVPASMTTSDRAAAENVVRGAYQDLLGRDPDPEGLRTFSDAMVNEHLTAGEVRTRIRNSPEFRATQLVRQAYRRVLGREPDLNSHTYVEKIVNEGWTQRQVENALRDSDEYRTRRSR